MLPIRSPRSLKRTRTAWPWLLHPLLAGLYFVLTLAASNAGALRGSGDLAWPLVTVLGVAVIFWGLALALARDPQKAAPITFLWMVAFSVFGYVTDALTPSGALWLTGGELGLCGVFLVILVGPTLMIRNTRADLQPFNRYATVVTGLLVAYTGVQLTRGLLGGRPGEPLAVELARTETRDPSDVRDIYFIVLDNYTGGEVLGEHFGYDNSEFENSLRARGFIVPRHGRANYPATQLSLASMLNFDYVQHLPSELSLAELIENNRLAALLKRQGYRFLFFPTGFAFTARNRNADLQLPEPVEVGSEFGGVWQRTTMLPELLRIGCSVLGCRAGRFVYVSEDAALLDWKFERLQDTAGGTVPTFAFAHIGIAHEPYLYRADCTYRDPYWPLNGGLPGDEDAAGAYLDQITCLNRKITVLVDSILARSPRHPVILLQADHGYGRLGRRMPAYATLTGYQIRERMSVFSAYYLPALGSEEVGDSITPVNAVRVVLRRYLGADLPSVEDAGYWPMGPERQDLARVAE